jgi:hypothetical protein
VQEAWKPVLTQDAILWVQITADCKGFEKLEAETVQWMEIKLGNEIEEYSNKNLYNQSR